MWNSSPLLASACLSVSLIVGASGLRAAVDPRIAAGDEAWARRQEGGSGLDPAPGPIAEAIQAYGSALETHPNDLVLRWKLMRALHYQGDYVLATREEKLAVFERGRDVGEGSLDLLAAGVGGRVELDRMTPAEVVEALTGHPEAVPSYFWTCVHWGLWGRERGKLAAARQGVAHRVRDYAQIVIGLDEHYQLAGGHRILGRLHFEAPKVPLVTGWVDKSRALEHLERAVEIAPEHPLSQLYLAEAVYDRFPERKAEAIERLQRVIEAGPRPDAPFEDGRTLVTARRLLESWLR